MSDLVPKFARVTIADQREQIERLTAEVTRFRQVWLRASDYVTAKEMEMHPDVIALRYSKMFDELEALEELVSGSPTPPAQNLQNELDEHDCGDVRFKQIEPWLYKCEGCGIGISWQVAEYDPITTDGRESS